jgi:hypothetical protein
MNGSRRAGENAPPNSQHKDITYFLTVKWKTVVIPRRDDILLGTMLLLLNFNQFLYTIIQTTSPELLRIRTNACLVLSLEL